MNNNNTLVYNKACIENNKNRNDYKRQCRDVEISIFFFVENENRTRRGFTVVHLTIIHMTPMGHDVVMIIVLPLNPTFLTAYNGFISDHIDGRHARHPPMQFTKWLEMENGESIVLRYIYSEINVKHSSGYDSSIEIDY